MLTDEVLFILCSLLPDINERYNIKYGTKQKELNKTDPEQCLAKLKQANKRAHTYTIA